MPYTQDDKLISIDTPLGEDVLLLTGLSGEEGISRTFSFELSLLSENHAIPFDAIIGKNVTVAINLPDGNKRYLNGTVSSFSQGRGGGEEGADTRFTSYRATMVPWFWVLTRSSDSRIFQNLSVGEIVEKVFKDKGLTDYRLDLQRNYDKKEFCVQYRETDHNFVSRLLEEEGIFYYFEHQQGKHTMVLADSSNSHKHCPGQKAASYELSAAGAREQDAITHLEMTRQVRAAKWVLNDFNFKVPNNDLKMEVQSTAMPVIGSWEIYDYPGNFDNKLAGDRLAKIRIEEEEAQLTRISGLGGCRSFTSGYRFTLKDHYRVDLNDKDYVLVAVRHQATEGYGIDCGGAYSNYFECLPFSVQYRPHRLTPKPVVPGAQTAIVVGPAGEEIYTDEHGRVKVQFHWDREGKRDDKSSCWIRVGQAWAGNGWGGLHIPRVGHEVIVSFIEGDPDRPIVTGHVYHGINRPPYPLPDQKTMSTLKSNSTKGGDGFNEIRFEDKQGREEIYLHGQKDWNIEILNDKNQSIGHDETLQVANNRVKSIGVNQTVRVGANHTETIGANKTETVAINKAEAIGAAKELTIGGLYQVTVGAAMNETVVGAKAEEVGLAKAVIVGAHMTEKVVGNRAITVGRNLAVTVTENCTLTAKTILLEADDEIVFKTGSATISMKSNGEIIIKGASITEKASGEIVIKGAKTAIN